MIYKALIFKKKKKYFIQIFQNKLGSTLVLKKNYSDEALRFTKD